MVRNNRRERSSRRVKSAKKITPSRKNRRNSTATPHFGLEPLESRLFLSADISLAGGVLTLTGITSQTNSIDVQSSPNGTQIDVSVNSDQAVYNVSSVSSIVINGGNDGDMILVDPQVSVPATINAGSSPNYISAGANDTVNGGNNDDIIVIDGSPIADDSYVPTSTSTSTGSGSTSSGSSSSGSSSSGSSSSGTSSSGSGSSSTGTSSSGSSSSGSSSTGSSSSGSSSSGSSSTGSSSTGTSSSGSGSSSTGSGSSSTGSSSSGSSSSGSGTVTGNPKPIITLTSDSTIYPYESVNVNALSTTNWGDSNLLVDTIAWNFGDAGGENNTLVGFNAAHDYTKSGTYTITLTITNPDGTSGAATEKVTVLADNRTTLYVSPTGNDNNSGLSASDPIKSIAEVNALMTSNMRILFQDGGTYDTTTGVNVNAFSHVFIGSYGSGAQPILMYTGALNFSDVINTQVGTTDLAVVGLTMDSIYDTNPTSTADLPTGVRLNGSGFNIDDNTFMNLYIDMDLSNAPSNVLLADNTSPSLTALRKYFVWTAGTNISIIGNTVANSDQETTIRCDGVTDLLIADNTINDNIKGSIAVQFGIYAYVYHNTITNGTAGVGPLSTSLPDSLANAAAVFTNCVFDSNTFDDTLVIQPGVYNVAIKNNLFAEDGSPGITINATNVLYPQRLVQNIYILNNTDTDTTMWGGLLKLVSGEATNIVVDNNVFADPSYQTGEGQALIYVGNNDMDSFTQIADNIWQTPEKILGWAQGGVFYMNATSGVQSGYLTPAEWEALNVPYGDVYESNIVFGSTYQVAAGGFTAGSSLLTGN